jgi:curved DNA-binding protein
MKDYYGILGVPKTATQDEVKKAYRKMAMKHHPDRGGDQAKFKEINEAHDVLSDNDKRMMVDQGIDPLNPNQRNQSHHFHSGGSPFEFHFGGGNPHMDEFFRGFGFGFGSGPQWANQQPRKNKSLNINLNLCLEEAYTGVSKELELTYPGNNVKSIKIEIPRGVDNGVTIRYEGMGDRSSPQIPPGDLLVNINVMPHPAFARDGINLLRDVMVDCFSAITGTSVAFMTLDGRRLEVTIPPGIQPGTTLGLKNEGMRDNKGNIGKLYVRVNVQIPTHLSDEVIELVEQIKNKI